MSFAKFVENQDQLSRMRSDMELMDRNHKLAIEDFKQEMARNLANALGQPIQALQADMARLEQAYPGDQNVENVAICVQTLLRRLQRFMPRT